MEGTVRSIETSAPPAEAFAVAADVESYTDWASAVKEVEVLETDEDDRAIRVRFVVDGMIKRIQYVLQYEYEPPNLMTWTAEPGPDIEEMQGSYEFNELEDGATEIVYSLAVAPAFSVPGFLRKQAEKQIVTTALRDLKRRVEELAGVE